MPVPLIAAAAGTTARAAGTALRSAARATAKGAKGAARSAQQSGKRFAKNRLKMSARNRDESTDDTSAEKPAKKLSGISFLIMLILTIVKDVSDAVEFTGVGVVVVVITSAIISGTLGLYYYFNNVSVDDRKIAVWVTGFILEFAVVTSWIPSTFLSLIITRVLENKKAVISNISEKVNKLKAKARNARGVAMSARNLRRSTT